MTECTSLSDRMVAVAHGRAAWSPVEDAHLESCRDCAAEWQLVRATARLGAEATTGLAPEFMATRVLAALGGPVPGRMAWLRPVRWLALPIAAAAALVIWQRSGPTAPVEAPVVASVELLPELDGLEADDLQALLELLPASTAPVGDRQGLDDLTEEELQAMLRSMEG